MAPKLIFKSAVGILIVLVIGAMLWQAAPAAAGFTPTPPPTARPTARSHPPTETPVPPTAAPTATATPSVLLPVTGGSASGPNNIEINAVSLAGGLVLLLVAISLVIRKSARTNTDH